MSQQGPKVGQGDVRFCGGFGIWWMNEWMKSLLSWAETAFINDNSNGWLVTWVIRMTSAW